MVFTRVNGKYSIEATNLTKEDFAKDIAQIAKMLKEVENNEEDILFVTDLIEDKVN